MSEFHGPRQEASIAGALSPNTPAKAVMWAAAAYALFTVLSHWDFIILHHDAATGDDVQGGVNSEPKLGDESETIPCGHFNFSYGFCGATPTYFTHVGWRCYGHTYGAAYH